MSVRVRPFALSRIRLRAIGTLAITLSACGETTITIDAPETKPDGEIELERGLVAHLRFDETEAGSEAQDASGYGHHGTPSASPPTPSLDVPSVGFANPRSLAFDGVEQLIDLGNPASLDVSGNVTLAAWIRPLAIDGYRSIVAHGFRLEPNGELSIRIYEEDYEFTFWDGMDHMASAPIPPGDVDTWHHLVGVHDAGAYRLYRDGELVVEHPDTVVPTQIDAAWAVGGRSATTPPSEERFFAGLIDEVRIYGRALSRDEVRALFRL
jgi:hypothetical protein